MVKNLTANTGDIGDAASIPGSGRLPGGGPPVFLPGQSQGQRSRQARGHRVAESDTTEAA